MRIRQHVVPAKAGTHTPQQYRETAEYGSRASLTLARDDSTSTRRRRPRLREDRLQRGPIRRSNIEKLRSMDPGPRSRSPGTTAHQHVVPVPACARTGSSGDPYAVAISRNCGVWIPCLARARPGRQHINTSSPSPPARGQAPAGTHTPQQYRETAEYGSRASLTLARDDSTSTRRPRPRLREDRLQRGPIRRNNIERLRSMDPGPRSRSPGTTAHQHVVPAKAGTHTPPQYRETAEYGSRASLTLARDDSTSTRRRRPRLREDRLQRGPIRRSNIEKLRSMDPGPRSRSPGTTTAHANTSSPSPPARGQAPAGTHTPETAECGSAWSSLLSTCRQARLSCHCRQARLSPSFAPAR